MASRNIKLEVSTSRTLHSSTKYEELSTTILSDEKIIWAGRIPKANELHDFTLLMTCWYSIAYIRPIWNWL